MLTRDVKPNPRWMQVLNETYTGMRPRSTKSPWTRTQALQLGVLFWRAWGVMPIAKRMDANYCLPDVRTILTIFGTKQAYYEAIAAACAGEERA